MSKTNWVLIVSDVLSTFSVIFYLLWSLHLFSDSLTSVTAVNLLTNQEIPVVISAKNNFENFLDTKIGRWHLMCKWNSIVFNCCVGAPDSVTANVWTRWLSSGLWNPVLHYCSSLVKKEGKSSYVESVWGRYLQDDKF